MGEANPHAWQLVCPVPVGDTEIEAIIPHALQTCFERVVSPKAAGK